MNKQKLNKILLSLSVLVTIQEVYHISRSQHRRVYVETILPSRTERNEYAHDVFIRVSTPKVISYDFENSSMGKEFSVKKTNCVKIIDNNQDEIKEAKNITAEMLPERDVELSIYMELRYRCSKFKERRGYILDNLSEEEKQFPIAFSLLLFKDFHQVERLLRTIYRHHNYYCLHIDVTANPLIQAVVRVYAECFDNMVWSNEVDIKWGSFSLSEAEFTCMYALQKFKKWKYFINLTGQEYPLKTNLQIVKILKELQGSNDLWTSPPRHQGERFVSRWNKLGPVPHGIKLVKGSSHLVLSRPFVDFLTSDERVVNLASYLHPTVCPEEALWTSINNDLALQAPGGFNGTPTEGYLKPWFAREKRWFGMKQRCGSRYVRGICIFGVSNIHALSRSLAMFGNKFYWDNQPMAL